MAIENLFWFSCPQIGAEKGLKTVFWFYRIWVVVFPSYCTVRIKKGEKAILCREHFRFQINGSKIVQNQRHLAILMKI